MYYFKMATEDTKVGQAIMCGVEMAAKDMNQVKVAESRTHPISEILVILGIVELKLSCSQRWDTKMATNVTKVGRGR